VQFPEDTISVFEKSFAKIQNNIKNRKYFSENNLYSSVLLMNIGFACLSDLRLIHYVTVFWCLAFGFCWCKVTEKIRNKRKNWGKLVDCRRKACVLERFLKDNWDNLDNFFGCALGCRRRKACVLERFLKDNWDNFLAAHLDVVDEKLSQLFMLSSYKQM